MSRPSKFKSMILARCAAELADAEEPLGSRFRVCPATTGLNEKFHKTCSDCNDTICAKMAEFGIDDLGQPLTPRDRPKCGALTRKRRPCCLQVVPGKRRCRFHGGASTGPKTAAGKARIAAAQKLRWEQFRNACAGSVKASGAKRTGSAGGSTS